MPIYRTPPPPMLSRNIHSLSLALPPPPIFETLLRPTAAAPAAVITTTATASPSTSATPSLPAHTCQAPASPPSPTLAVADKTHHHHYNHQPQQYTRCLALSSSTVLREGQVTPATPSFPSELKDTTTTINQEAKEEIRQQKEDIEEKEKELEKKKKKDDNMPAATLPTPSPSASPASSVDADDGLDWFLAERYAPLSHLPTPPLSGLCSPETNPDEDHLCELLEPEFTGKSPFLPTFPHSLFLPAHKLLLTHTIHIYTHYISSASIKNQANRALSQCTQAQHDTLPH